MAVTVSRGTRGATGFVGVLRGLGETLIAILRQRWGRKYLIDLQELRDQTNLCKRGMTMSVMKIEGVSYELTDTPLGKEGPSSVCEPNPEHQIPLSRVPQALRGCRSQK